MGAKMAKAGRTGITSILAELRRELKGRGLRVATLAEQLGVAEPTVWRWLRGEGLTLNGLDDICAAAGLDLRDLLGRASGAAQDSFTLAQERVLAADRGLALIFFAILHGAQLNHLTQEFGLPIDRLNDHLDRLERLGLVSSRAGGRLRPKTVRTVRWRKGGPLSTAFERTVKPLFMSMDFGTAEAQYISDMFPLSVTGRTHVQALFENLRHDIHMIVDQEAASGLEGRAWSGILMMLRPFDVSELTAEWRNKAKRK